MIITKMTMTIEGVDYTTAGADQPIQEVVDRMKPAMGGHGSVWLYLETGQILIVPPGLVNKSLLKIFQVEVPERDATATDSPPSES